MRTYAIGGSKRICPIIVILMSVRFLNAVKDLGEINKALPGFTL